MAILFVAVYVAGFTGLWFLLQSVLKALLKNRYRPSYLLVAYLAMLPLLMVAMGFLALALIPVEI